MGRARCHALRVGEESIEGLDAQTMQTGLSREDAFILPFLSAYEDGTWADAETRKPDALDRANPAVDRIATRKVDGKTLAIEHTIIEPFVGDQEEFASFQSTF